MTLRSHYCCHWGRLCQLNIDNKAANLKAIIWPPNERPSFQICQRKGRGLQIDPSFAANTQIFSPQSLPYWSDRATGKAATLASKTELSTSGLHESRQDQCPFNGRWPRYHWPGGRCASQLSNGHSIIIYSTKFMIPKHLLELFFNLKISFASFGNIFRPK